MERSVPWMDEIRKRGQSGCAVCLFLMYTVAPVECLMSLMFFPPFPITAPTTSSGMSIRSSRFV